MVKANSLCMICSAPFYASPGHAAKGWGKYCSMACRNRAMSKEGNGRYKAKQGWVACKSCGKSYKVKPSSVAIGKHKTFCSLECRENFKFTSISCIQCGAIFETRKNLSKQKYFCGRACESFFRLKYNIQKMGEPRVKRICLQCGNEFLIKQSDLKRGKRGVGSFCNIECKARYMSNHAATVEGSRRTARGGKREDLGFYVRSSWEANYARYLIWLESKNEIINWAFEPDTFEFEGIKRGSRFYTPDFKITNKNGTVEYHEIKGYMDAQSATKLKRMKKYHPNIKIVLIDKTQYYALAKQLKNLIENWE